MPACHRRWPICRAECSRSSFRGERRRVARLRAGARQRPGSNVASQPHLAAEAGAQRLARALCATARRSPAHGPAPTAGVSELSELLSAHCTRRTADLAVGPAHCACRTADLAVGPAHCACRTADLAVGPAQCARVVLWHPSQETTELSELLSAHCTRRTADLAVGPAHCARRTADLAVGPAQCAHVVLWRPQRGMPELVLERVDGGGEAAAAVCEHGAGMAVDAHDGR